MAFDQLVSASDAARSLYLPPDRSGVAWLLDPNSAAASRLARQAKGRSRGDACDAAALAADLPDLAVLLAERHFGIADGVLDPAAAEDVLERWQHRLRAEQPQTWGQALGTSVHDLRWLFHDNHLWAAGEDSDLLREVDRRADEPLLQDDPGPVVSEEIVEGVLCIRLRQCGGGGPSGRLLTQQWRDDHARHFTHDRILVDLRGNPGGEDSHMIAWIRDHVRRDVAWPGWREWRIGEQVVNRWNVAVFSEPEGRGASLESIIDAFALRTSNSLRTVDEPYTIPRSPSPWSGRMLVLTDKGSASAAESAAWMLRTGLDAKIIGGRSAGAVGFGNLAPYLLPRSGLKLDLPTASSGWHEESMTGMPIDLAYDVRATLHETAANFDALHADAQAASREVSVEPSAASGAIEVPRC